MEIDITQAINAAMLLVIALASAYLTHLQKKSKNAEALRSWVKIAVSAAEQAYKVGLTTDRKAYALDVLKKRGFTVDWSAIDDMVEAAVNSLPPKETGQLPETMLDGKGEA